MASDEERARELIAAFELDLGWAHPRDRLWDDGEREKLVERIAHALTTAREAALREALVKLGDMPAPSMTCCSCIDDGYGEAIGSALAAVRALLPAPPPPPTKGTP